MTGLARAVLAAGALVALLLSVASPTANAAEGPVAPERSDYSVQANCRPLIVPVVLASTSPSLVPGSDKPVRVSGVDETWANSLNRFFTADVATSGRTVRIHLGRENSRTPCAELLPPPGTYHLVVAVEAIHSYCKTSPASVAVDVTVPAATLTGTSSLAIQQYVTCPFNFCLGGDPPHPTGTITLRDSSMAAAVADIRVGATLDYLSDQPVVKPNAIVVFTNDDIVIRPGQQGTFGVAVSGDLPPGTTKVRAEIVSPEAPSGLNVSVTVTRRQSWISFGLVLLAGLLLGVLTRKKLTELIEAGRRRRRAEDVIARLRAQAALTTDPTLREQLRDIADHLGPDVRAAATPAMATQAIEQAERNGETAVADLASRLARAVNERDVWSAQLDGSVWATQVIGNQLEAGRAEIGQVDEAIRARNAVRASQLVNEQRTEIVARALGAAQNWTDGMREHLNELRRGECPGLLPARLRTSVNARADQFDEATAEIRDGTIQTGANREMSNLQAALNRAAGFIELIDEQLRNLGFELDQAVNALIQKWGCARDDQLAKNVRHLQASPGKETPIIETLGRRTKLACASVGQMRVFLARAADQNCVPGDLLAQYHAAVKESDYARLTTLAKATLRPRPLGAAPATPVEAQAGPAAVYTAAGPAYLDTAAPPPEGQQLPGPGVISTKLFTGLRWALLAGALLLAAWFVLPRTMVGTPAQLVGLFFFAFSIDLAFEGLSKVAEGWASGPRIG
jgi:hypothetical protein